MTVTYEEPTASPLRYTTSYYSVMKEIAGYVDAITQVLGAPYASITITKQEKFVDYSATTVTVELLDGTQTSFYYNRQPITLRDPIPGT